MPIGREIVNSAKLPLMFCIIITVLAYMGFASPAQAGHRYSCLSTNMSGWVNGKKYDIENKQTQVFPNFTGEDFSSLWV